MKTVIHLRLPALASYFCGRHSSVMAIAARPRGNAAGAHGGRAKYGKRERQRNRQEERDARVRMPAASDVSR